MKIHKYKDYDEYVSEQTKYNKKKIRNVYVKESTIKRISEIQEAASSILCHGTRNGAEIKFFETYYPNATVTGSEISETAKNFPNTVQWDMQEPKEEWVGEYDVVYSNSFDHAIDPVKCLTTWKEQLAPYGRLFVEASLGWHNFSTSMDPLEISKKELLDIAEQVGLGHFHEWEIGDGVIVFAFK